MSIQTLNIHLEGETIVQGDTIHKITLAYEHADDIDLTGAINKMQIYKKGIEKIDIEKGSGITLIDSKTFEIDKVAKEDNNYPVGTFTGDLEITFANGERKTYLRIDYTISKQYTV